MRLPWMAVSVGYRNWVETPDATIQRPYTLAGFAEFFNWTAGENENALFASPPHKQKPTIEVGSKERSTSCPEHTR